MQQLTPHTVLLAEVRRIQRENGLDRQIPKKDTIAIPLPCIHEGRPRQPPEGKDARKLWFECGVGKGVVCKCNNCGCVCNESCDKYVADTDDV